MTGSCCRSSTYLALAAAVALGAGELGAQNYTVDFSDVVGSNGTQISPTHGTVPGVVTLTNRGKNDFGAGATTSDICLWTANYGDLANVAYTCSDAAGVGEIRFVAMPGYSITLNSFDIGEYVGRVSGNAEVRLFDIGYGSTLFSSSMALTSGMHWTLTPGVSSTTGFNLQWGDSWDYGIDNINFTVTQVTAPPTSTVPEPMTVALMGTGLAAIGAVTRLRRRSTE